MPKSSKKIRRTTASKVAIAATIFSVPMMGSPLITIAHPGVKDSLVNADAAKLHLKFGDIAMKNPGKFTIVGLDNNHTIYKKNTGELFYIEPLTGDMKSVSNDYYLKFDVHYATIKGQAAKMYKIGENKNGGQVTLVGIDAAGHVVQKDSRGQLFFLDNSTGDMVPVK